MLEGLYSAAAGMAAQQEQLDAIGNDLANVSTEGYKSERVAFSDLLYSSVEQAGSKTTAGAGASAAIIGRSEAQGALRQTGSPLDVAIEGDGYIQVKDPGGKTALTRDGALRVDASGTLTTASGHRLEPPIVLPKGVSAQQLSIAPDGTVSADTKKLGQIALVTVAAPDRLSAEGSGGLIANAGSGPVHAATGARLRQGALEQSNVDVAKEMALMVSTQRGYQMARTAIQTESQMMSIANQLKA